MFYRLDLDVSRSRKRELKSKRSLSFRWPYKMQKCRCKHSIKDSEKSGVRDYTRSSKPKSSIFFQMEKPLAIQRCKRFAGQAIASPTDSWRLFFSKDCKTILQGQHFIEHCKVITIQFKRVNIIEWFKRYHGFNDLLPLEALPARPERLEHTSMS